MALAHVLKIAWFLFHPSVSRPRRKRKYRQEGGISAFSMPVAVAWRRVASAAAASFGISLKNILWI
jgi:hypothetical protein